MAVPVEFSELIANLSNTSGISESFLGGALGGAAVTLGLGLIIVIALAFYVYFALAWMTIAQKLKHKRPWLAWIPIANFALILQLGGFHWALVFLALIPVIGWLALSILMIIAAWKIYEKRKYPGWLALAPLLDWITGGIGSIINLIVIGFVAWKDKKK
ncbi:MAG: hypothetical protein ACTSWK_16805 [Promethearchaeota archaeon]